MFKEILTAAILLFILSNIISYIRKPELATTQLPKIEAVLLEGSQFKVKKNKPLLIHFWSTWCPACKLEAPNIETVSKTYEVLTIAVNSGDDANINDFLQEKGLTFKVLNDADGKWAEAFKVQAFPTTFIYDAQGRLKFTEVGYTTTAGLLARLKLAD
jgi:thiol-disulfide isomerase/thioredoxin